MNLLVIGMSWLNMYFPASWHKHQLSFSRPHAILGFAEAHSPLLTICAGGRFPAATMTPPR